MVGAHWRLQREWFLSAMRPHSATFIFSSKIMSLAMDVGDLRDLASANAYKQ
jgi:hypothetical protein